MVPRATGPGKKRAPDVAAHGPGVSRAASVPLAPQSPRRAARLRSVSAADTGSWTVLCSLAQLVAPVKSIRRSNLTPPPRQRDPASGECVSGGGGKVGGRADPGGLETRSRFASTCGGAWVGHWRSHILQFGSVGVSDVLIGRANAGIVPLSLPALPFYAR
jgi:hypothetical protein